MVLLTVSANNGPNQTVAKTLKLFENNEASPCVSDGEWDVVVSEPAARELRDGGSALNAVTAADLVWLETKTMTEFMKLCDIVQKQAAALYANGEADRVSVKVTPGHSAIFVDGELVCERGKEEDRLEVVGVSSRGFCVSADVEKITADSYRELNDDDWAEIADE